MAERAVPLPAALAKALSLDAMLLRAYGVPSVGYAGEDNFTAINYSEILDAARDEAKRYIDRMAAEMKELGVPGATS